MGGEEIHRALGDGGGHGLKTLRWLHVAPWDAMPPRDG